MKKSIYFLAIIFVAMSFAGCPGKYIDPAPSTDTHAYIYNPADSVYVRFYTMPDGVRFKTEMTLTASEVAQVVEWYGGYSQIYGDKEYDSEYNDLHIQKKSNEATAYVLRSAYVIVNGQTITWDHFPSRYYDIGGSVLPYIEQVIDTLLVHYPDAVIAIDDLEEHSIYNDKAGMAPPSITIND